MMMMMMMMMMIHVTLIALVHDYDYDLVRLYDYYPRMEKEKQAKKVNVKRLIYLDEKQCHLLHELRCCAE